MSKLPKSSLQFMIMRNTRDVKVVKTARNIFDEHDNLQPNMNHINYDPNKMMATGSHENCVILEYRNLDLSQYIQVVVNTTGVNDLYVVWKQFTVRLGLDRINTIGLEIKEYIIRIVGSLDLSNIYGVKFAMYSEQVQQRNVPRIREITELSLENMTTVNEIDRSLNNHIYQNRQTYIINSTGYEYDLQTFENFRGLRTVEFGQCILNNYQISTEIADFVRTFIS